MTTQGQAELAQGTPKLEFVGPTVDHDIRRAISRYGKDAVKDAVKRLTKPKRGRKPELDWPLLREVIEEDARDWLHGGNPLETRTNYAIAKAFAEQYPGQSAVSTHQRISRKLGKSPFGRKYFMYAIAMELSRDAYPHALHLKALKALADQDPNDASHTLLKFAESDVANYNTRLGKAPPPQMTMQEIRDAASNALLAQGSQSQPRGLLGLLSPFHAASANGE